MSTLVKKWENEDTLQNIKKSKNKNVRTKIDKPSPTGTIKMRILPTLKQQMVLKRWLGGSNYTYNRALHDIKYNNAPVQYNSLVSSHALDFDRYGKSRLPDFLSYTPSDIRKSILNELVIAYNTARTNRKRGNIKKFNIDYKRKKNQRNRFSFPVPYTSVKIYVDQNYPDEYRLDVCTTKMKECLTNTKRNAKVFSSVVEQCRLLQEENDVKEYYPECNTTTSDFKTIDTRIKNIDSKLIKQRNGISTVQSRQKPDVNTSIRIARLSRPGRNKTLDHIVNMKSIKYNCKICYRYGHWYIHIPYVRNEYKEPENNLEPTIVALDPGFKTFQTYYSLNDYGKYQQDDKRLKQICNMLDYYKWSLNHKWHSPKYVKLKTDKLYRKQLNLIEEMHQKVINNLTHKYNWILLPSFETQDMLEGRGYTKNKRDVKRLAYQLSHFKFKENLQQRCKQMKHCKVITVSEAWTTKTCTLCGWVWANMTTMDRIFKCKECDNEIDRDVNAARNILIRTLTG
jgi:putative transposase